jgi:hypothetical protein
MRYRWRVVAGVMLFFLMAVAGHAEKRQEPLSYKEIDDLREANLDPDKRLKLFIEYARSRLASMEQARSDPKTTDRAGLTHDWLTDFLQIYDELDDNVDMYVDRGEDFRPALKALIEADAEFQSRLLGLKNAGGVSLKEYKEYEFILSNSLETLASSSESHKQLLAQQEEAAKKKKKKK